MSCSSGCGVPEPHRPAARGPEPDHGPVVDDGPVPGAPSAWGRMEGVTTLHDPEVRGFASDNYAGVHPEVLAALAAANGGHQVSYGEDEYTENLQKVIRSHFGPYAE